MTALPAPPRGADRRRAREPVVPRRAGTGCARLADRAPRPAAMPPRPTGCSRSRPPAAAGRAAHRGLLPGARVPRLPRDRREHEVRQRRDGPEPRPGGRARLPPDLRPRHQPRDRRARLRPAPGVREHPQPHRARRGDGPRACRSSTGSTTASTTSTRCSTPTSPPPTGTASSSSRLGERPRVPRPRGPRRPHPAPPTRPRRSGPGPRPAGAPRDRGVRSALGRDADLGRRAPRADRRSSGR